MLLLLTAITIATYFESGSLGKVEWVTPTHLRAAVKGQSDQDGRNRQANWYYFRLDNLPRQEIRIELTDLVGEYNYRPGTYAVTRNSRPVYSYDNLRWHHFSDRQVEWDPEQIRLNLRITPARSRMWIAHVPPYTTRQLAALLKEIAGHPHVRVESAGRTTLGRDLPLVTVTDPGPAEAAKKVVWIMARQHAWETGTSWVVEGALRRLASSSPAAARLRRQFVWKFFPMGDPDGVVYGNVRFNVLGYDVNRNWDTADPRRTAEIWAMKTAMWKWLDSGGRIDLFLALHNQEAGDYIDGPAGPTANRFFEALAATSSFQAVKGPRDTVSTGKIDPGRMTVYQALYRERGIQAFLMELGVERNMRLGRPRTTADNLRFGEELLEAIVRALL